MCPVPLARCLLAINMLPFRIRTRTLTSPKRPESICSDICYFSHIWNDCWIRRLSFGFLLVFRSNHESRKNDAAYKWILVLIEIWIAIAFTIDVSSILRKHFDKQTKYSYFHFKNRQAKLWNLNAMQVCTYCAREPVTHASACRSLQLHFYCVRFCLVSVFFFVYFKVPSVRLPHGVDASVAYIDSINWINCASTYAIPYTICGIFMRAHRNKRRFQTKHENYVNWSVVCARCAKNGECAETQCVIRQRII